MQPEILDAANLLRLVQIFDVLAAIVFAASGSLVAARKGMDIVGFMWLAVITGVGGGTVRNLILDGAGLLGAAAGARHRVPHHGGGDALRGAAGRIAEAHAGLVRRVRSRARDNRRYGQGARRSITRRSSPSRWAS